MEDEWRRAELEWVRDELFDGLYKDTKKRGRCLLLKKIMNEVTKRRQDVKHFLCSALVLCLCQSSFAEMDFMH